MQRVAGCCCCIEVLSFRVLLGVTFVRLGVLVQIQLLHAAGYMLMRSILCCCCTLLLVRCYTLAIFLSLVAANVVIMGCMLLLCCMTLLPADGHWHCRCCCQSCHYCCCIRCLLPPAGCCSVLLLNATARCYRVQKSTADL